MKRPTEVIVRTFQRCSMPALRSLACNSQATLAGVTCKRKVMELDSVNGDSGLCRPQLLDRPAALLPRRALGAAGAARPLPRSPPLRRDPGVARGRDQRAEPAPGDAWSRRASPSAVPTASTRSASNTASPTRVATWCRCCWRCCAGATAIRPARRVRRWRPSTTTAARPSTWSRPARSAARSWTPATCTRGRARSHDEQRRRAEEQRRRNAERRAACLSRGAGADRRLRLSRSRAGGEAVGRGLGGARDQPQRARVGADRGGGDRAGAGRPRPRRHGARARRRCCRRLPAVRVAEGEPDAVAAIHGPRLERLLEKLVDTPVRGVVYEATGSVDPALLAAGAEIVEAASRTWHIPIEIVRGEPKDPAAWSKAMADLALGLLSPGRGT